MLRYPPTLAGHDVDNYHGEAVADPYRWLETTSDPRTAAWIAAQNEVTEAVLGQVAERASIRSRLTELASYARYGTPFERGGRWFQFRNDGLHNQPVLYVMTDPGEPGRPLLDPNTLAEDGTAAVSAAAVSSDGRLLAYSISVSGSDWQTWRVRDVESGEDLPDLIEWSKFCEAAWRKDGSGFYYSAPTRPPEGAEYLAAIGVRRIFFHKIGTSSSDDELVYSTPPGTNWHADAHVSDDGRFLIISISDGTAPQAQLHVLDLADPAAKLTPLIGDFESIADLVTTNGSVFYLVTDYQAERKRLVAVKLDEPDRQHWTEIIGQGPDTLLAARFFGGRFVCHYLRKAHSVLAAHEADGTFIREIPLPRYSSIADGCNIGNGIAGREDSDLIHFGVTSFAESGSLWSHQLTTGQTKLLRPCAAAIDPDSFVVEQVNVTSADGTDLTMFLARRGDLRPDGDQPVLLYGYGGFDIAVTPSFTVLHAGWLAGGGVLAVANLRGGGEYGRAWHDAGRLAVKQNVFDDFCACARWLASSGWSRPGRIATYGRSNGGLLVGACLTQHPELFGACVAGVGVLDMLRFHRFTVGRAWVADYGSPDDADQYHWLRAYSPLHNLRAGQRYPATLLLTGDHDDRVVPGHSFKFAAALQAAQGGDAPTVIRIETSAGHGFGKPVAKVVAEAADVLTFLRLALGPASVTGVAGVVDAAAD
ncbi:MAG TPA: prolyl oligopeptidase family serine peptidase [Streptosporangiaceae bacterium]|nr:prolyl oligopeptidase family serine peptidase [Streptosporangiaceae bacterium]